MTVKTLNANVFGPPIAIAIPARPDAAATDREGMQPDFARIHAREVCGADVLGHEPKKQTATISKEHRRRVDVESQKSDR